MAIEAARGLPGEPVGAERYVGRFCESPVLEDDKCNGDFNNFCVNGGSCRTEGDDLDLIPCDCPDDFTGKHCEYEKAKVPDCDLDCGENGFCRLGAKTQTPFEAKLNIAPHASFMHCECREGFIGFNCDVPAKICGSEGNHWCLNGGECVTVPGQNGSSSWGCDCSAADSLVTGAACEQKASHVCPESTVPTPESSHLGFCVNGGICQIIFETGEQVCSCPSSLPSGPHCESLSINLGSQSPIRKKTTSPTASPTASPQVDDGAVADDKQKEPDDEVVAPQKTLPPENDSSGISMGPIIGGVVGAVIVLVIVVIVVIVMKRRRQKNENAATFHNNWPSVRPVEETLNFRSSFEHEDTNNDIFQPAVGTFAATTENPLEELPDSEDVADTGLRSSIEPPGSFDDEGNNII